MEVVGLFKSIKIFDSNPNIIQKVETFIEVPRIFPMRKSFNTKYREIKHAQESLAAAISFATNLNCKQT